MKNKKESSKEAAIKKELSRLNAIFAEVDERKRKTLEGIISECAFMRITLEELRTQININGVVDEMSQGDYAILRESPYVKTYHTMIQRYTTASERLIALLPKNAETVQSDGYDDFINERSDD